MIAQAKTANRANIKKFSTLMQKVDLFTQKEYEKMQHMYPETATTIICKLSHMKKSVNYI